MPHITFTFAFFDNLDISVYFCICMFRKLSILFTLMAVSLLIVHAVVPHHEHGDVICFEKMHNEEDHKHETTGTAKACCLDKQDVIRNQNEEIKIGSDCDHGSGCDYHFSHILLFVGNFFDLNPEPSEIVTKPYLNLYTSADIRSAQTLRGPPQA